MSDNQKHKLNQKKNDEAKEMIDNLEININ